MQQLIAYIQSRFKMRRALGRACLVLMAAFCVDFGLDAATVQFSDYFVSRGQLLDGTYLVTANFVTSPNNTVLWTYVPTQAVVFAEGRFSLEIPAAAIPDSALATVPLILQLSAGGVLQRFLFHRLRMPCIHGFRIMQDGRMLVQLGVALPVR